MSDPVMEAVIAELKRLRERVGELDRDEQASLVPTGAVSPFAGSAAPAGWLVCDGSAVSRATYARLFAAIATTWGAGDGSTTFNLPDLRGRAVIGVGTGSGLTARTLAAAVGAETVALTDANLNAHSHSIGGSSGAGTSHNHGVGTLAIGGEAAHTHGVGTLTEAAAGAHTHGGLVVLAQTGTRDAPPPSGLGTWTAVPSDGSHAHTLSGATAAGASHTHSITGSDAAEATHTHTLPAATGSVGSGTAHNNMQPSVALNYIIKA